MIRFEGYDTVTEEHGELHVVKEKRMPTEPSADEVAAHNVTRAPISVTGRGLSSEHVVKDHEYDALLSCLLWLHGDRGWHAAGQI